MKKNIIILKKAPCIVLFCLLLMRHSLSAQDLQIFELEDYEKRNKEIVGFISLSDIYPLSDHPDSLCIPDITEYYDYFELDSIYRDRFLSGTNVSETDTVFVYDYSKNKLASFTVKDLNVVARLNIYTMPQECPCPPYYYMIGFDIKEAALKHFGVSSFYHCLVYVGKRNPFAEEQLKPMIWEKADPKYFLSITSGVKDTAELPNPAKGVIYTFVDNGLQFFVQDVPRDDISINRSLVAIKTKTNEIVYREIFSSSEGTSPASLTFTQAEQGISEQWTGKLFKNKPAVVFGFEYHSFGCPGIALLNQPASYIGINCDSRH